MADTALTAYIRSAAPAGLTQDGDEFFVVRNVSGTDVILRAGPMKRGYEPSKDLVTTLIGGQNIRVYDPINDRGYVLRSKGIDNNIVQIPNYAFTQITIDATYGEPFFLVARRSTAMVFVNPQPGTNLRPGPENDTPNPLANTGQLVGLTAAVVGDCAYVTSTSLYYVLTALPNTSAGNWLAMPAGAPGLMTIYNDDGLELNVKGAERRYTFIGPNEVVSS